MVGSLNTAQKVKKNYGNLRAKNSSEHQVLEIIHLSKYINKEKSESCTITKQQFA